MTTSLLLRPHGKTMFWSLFKKQVKLKFTPGTVFPLLADLWQDQCSLDGSASLIRWAAVCEWRSLLFVWFSMTLFLSLSDGLPLQGIILLQIVQLVWVASGFILLMSLLILFRSVFSRNRVILKPEYFFLRFRNCCVKFNQIFTDLVRALLCCLFISVLCEPVLVSKIPFLKT